MTKEALNKFGLTSEEMTEMLNGVAGEGHMDTMNFLLRQLPFGKDNLNEAMCVAAQGGHNDMVRLLTDHGADNLDDAMTSAVFLGRTDTVMLLRNLGALDFARALRLVESGVYRRPGTVGLLRIFMAESKPHP